jgi:penicillin amidase
MIRKWIPTIFVILANILFFIFLPISFFLLIIVSEVICYVFIKRKFIYLLAILINTRPKNQNMNLINVTGLKNNVYISFDSYGVPKIEAEDIQDCSFALGYIIAKDRLFQMDYLRRESYGELSEIFGKTFIDKDKAARQLKFKNLSKQVVQHIQEDEREILSSYAKGINYYIHYSKLKHNFEFKLLKYVPRDWEIVDCISVFLGFFRKLSYDGKDNIMSEVMTNILPKKVVDFLLQDEDGFNSQILNDPNRSFIEDMPKEFIRKTIRRVKQKTKFYHSIPQQTLSIGSNAWVKRVNMDNGYNSKLANDMHLPLTVPNLWYRAQINIHQYNNGSGIFLPGFPCLIAGSTKNINWGFTKFCGNNMNYLKLVTNTSGDSYLTDEGWKKFEYEKQIINVKDNNSVELVLKKTIYGVVSSEKILGHDIVLVGSLLDYKAINLLILKMWNVDNVMEGIQLMKHFGGPPMNVVIGDKLGNIGWTVCGKIFKKTSREIEGFINWKEYKYKKIYLKDEDKPDIVNPKNYFLVTANNRIIGKKYKYVLGENYFNGYRFYRITKLLKKINLKDNELVDFQNIQLDCYGEFYFFYRDLIFDAIKNKRDNFSNKIFNILNKWDGRAEKNSSNFSFLVDFHRVITNRILEPLLSEVKEKEPNFIFAWNNVEAPLRAILQEKDISLIYTKKDNFNDFIIEVCKEVYENINTTFKWNLSKNLKWGNTNKTFIFNILSFYYQELWSLLNMPAKRQSGCQNTVNVSWAGFGSSVRIISIPGEKGIISMPGGQSSHPLSKNYRDQFKKWIDGQYIDLSSGKNKYSLNFLKKGVSKK